jgi:anti-sigma factor RsiW
MTCKSVSQKLDSYLDGELTGGEMQAMRTHLYDCAACAEEAESYRSIKSALSNLPCCDPPVGLEERLMRSVGLEPAPAIRRHAGFVWTSAIAAAAAVGFVCVWYAGPRGQSAPSVVVKTNEPPMELSRDQAYMAGTDPLSGTSMVVTASYGGSSNGR